MVQNSIRVYARLKPKTIVLDETFQSTSYKIVNVDKASMPTTIVRSWKVPTTPFESLVILARKAGDGLPNNRPGSYSFNFSKVFDQSAEQDTIYRVVAKPVVDSFLQGYNGTIFAYGQTGSGKTFTISGRTQNDCSRGIIPRAMDYIFQNIRRIPCGGHHKVEMSFMEIYNESCYDLLSTNCRNEDHERIILQEDEEGEIQLKNLTACSVDCYEHFWRLFEIGEYNRMVSDTPLNQLSSRSHCILTIYLTVRPADCPTKIRRSKLHLVDLAGSERVAKTGLNGQTLAEARHINLSLHYLEQVIVALAERNRSHIPYRNSVMTNVLRDSLGGNCLTVMVATLAIEQFNLDETLSTCRFAQRVALLCNDVKVNEVYDQQWELSTLRAEVEKLRKQIAGWSGSGQPCRESGDDYADADTLEGVVRGDVSMEEVEECKRFVDDFITRNVENKLKSEAEEMPMKPNKVRYCFRLIKSCVLDKEEEKCRLKENAQKAFSQIHSGIHRLASQLKTSREQISDLTLSLKKIQPVKLEYQNSPAGNSPRITLSCDSFSNTQKRWMNASEPSLLAQLSEKERAERWARMKGEGEMDSAKLECELEKLNDKFNLLKSEQTRLVDNFRRWWDENEIHQLPADMMASLQEVSLNGLIVTDRSTVKEELSKDIDGRKRILTCPPDIVLSQTDITDTIGDVNVHQASDKPMPSEEHEADEYAVYDDRIRGRKRNGEIHTIGDIVRVNSATVVRTENACLSPPFESKSCNDKEESVSAYVGSRRGRPIRRKTYVIPSDGPDDHRSRCHVAHPGSDSDISCVTNGRNKKTNDNTYYPVSISRKKGETVRKTVNKSTNVRRERTMRGCVVIPLNGSPRPSSSAVSLSKEACDLRCGTDVDGRGDMGDLIEQKPYRTSWTRYKIQNALLEDKQITSPRKYALINNWTRREDERQDEVTDGDIGRPPVTVIFRKSDGSTEREDPSSSIGAYTTAKEGDIRSAERRREANMENQKANDSTDDYSSKRLTGSYTKSIDELNVTLKSCTDKILNCKLTNSLHHKPGGRCGTSENGKPPSVYTPTESPLDADITDNGGNYTEEIDSTPPVSKWQENGATKSCCTVTDDCCIYKGDPFLKDYDVVMKSYNLDKSRIERHRKTEVVDRTSENENRSKMLSNRNVKPREIFVHDDDSTPCNVGESSKITEWYRAKLSTDITRVQSTPIIVPVNSICSDRWRKMKKHHRENTITDARLSVADGSSPTALMIGERNDTRVSLLYGDVSSDGDNNKGCRSINSRITGVGCNESKSVIRQSYSHRSYNDNCTQTGDALLTDRIGEFIADYVSSPPIRRSFFNRSETNINTLSHLTIENAASSSYRPKFSRGVEGTPSPRRRNRYGYADDEQGLYLREMLPLTGDTEIDEEVLRFYRVRKES